MTHTDRTMGTDSLADRFSRRLRSGVGFALLVGCLAVLPASIGFAQTLGVVSARGSSSSVAVFDADSGDVLASIPLPADVRQLTIRSDQSLAFASTALGVFVIDLRARPPRLATGVNPIVVADGAGDLSLSPDEQLLLTHGSRFEAGSFFSVLSVIEIARRRELSTLDVENLDLTSIDLCPGGGVLATDNGILQIVSFRLRGSRVRPVPGFVEQIGIFPINVYCAPDGRTGFSITEEVVQTSFAASPLMEVTRRQLASFGISGLFHPRGDRIYVRSTTDFDFFGPGMIEVFPYDSASGAIGNPTLTTNVADSFPGGDQLAIHPDGSKLYVPQEGRVDVLDADTLAPMFSIADPRLSNPTIISLRRLRGDLDGDADIDLDDVTLLSLERNRAVSRSRCGLRCDLDGNGSITLADARKLALTCTRARCATR